MLTLSAMTFLGLLQSSPPPLARTVTYDVEVAPVEPPGPGPALPLVYSHLSLTLEQERDDGELVISGKYGAEPLKIRIGANESIALADTAISVHHSVRDSLFLTPPGVEIVEELGNSSTVEAHGILYRKDCRGDHVLFDESLDGGAIQRGIYTTYVHGTMVGRLTIVRTAHSASVTIPRVFLGCIASAAFIQLPTGHLSGLHCFEADRH